MGLAGLALLLARVVFAFGRKAPPVGEGQDLERAWRQSNADGL
jgi:hypothetical protein